MQDDLRRLQEEVKALREEQRRMGEQLEALSGRLAFMKGEPPSPKVSSLPPTRRGMPARRGAEQAVPPAAASPAPSPARTRDLEAKIGGIWLNRVGMIVFLLGAAFFLKLAYDWGWINETVRIAIGIIAAAVLLYLGERNRRRGFTAYGQGLTGGGIALLYFTIFASFYYYSLISSTAGMGLLILVTAGAVALAVFQNSRAVAVIGLLTGFLNPALFVAEEPRFVLLLVYLILLNLGIIAIVYLKRWSFIGVISFILTNLFLVWVPIYRFNQPLLGLPAVPAQVYFSILLLLFLALPLLNTVLRRHPMEAGDFFLFIAGAAAHYGLGWLNLHPEFPDVMGWFTLGLAGFYLLVGCVLLPASKHDPRAHFTGFSLAAALLVAFVPLQLRGAWILAGWTIQAALLCFLGLRLADRRIRSGFWIVLSLALLRLLMAEWPRRLDPAYYRFLINRTALLTFSFIAVLILLSLLYHRFRKEAKELPGEIVVLAGAAGLLLLSFGSKEIYHYSEVMAHNRGNADYYHNLALLMISLYWSVYAALLMAAGFIRRLPLLRYTAIGLFGLTVAKVIIFDLSFLELTYRIISLVVSGLILLGVSYLYQRHRDRINPAG